MKILIWILAVIVILVLFVAICRIVNKTIWQSRNKRRMELIAAQGEDSATIVGKSLIEIKERIYISASQILGTRSDQQDCYYVSGNAEFDLLHTAYSAAIVCDGMGGLSSGDIVSKMAVDYAVNSFNSYFNNYSVKNIPEFLKNIAINANQQVYQYSIDHCEGQMCGTTMVFALLENNNMYWLSIGDSRIYIIRNNQIVQITNDHNYGYILAQKVKEGSITADEAERDVHREALISYIGIDSLDIIDLSVNPFRLERGDVVLLCSDGLTKVLSDDEICEYVNKNKDNIDDLAKSLPMYAFDRNTGSQDNTTVAIICYK